MISRVLLKEGGNCMESEGKPELSEDFTRFLRQKRRFLLFASLLFLPFYFLFPVLIGWFPDQVNRAVWGPFSWAWLYAFAHFALVWILGLAYLRQARRWDQRVHRLRAEFTGESSPEAEGGGEGKSR